MQMNDFYNLYALLGLPVIVCKNQAEMPVEYLNVQAGLMLQPGFSAANRAENPALGPLADVLRLTSADRYTAFMQTLTANGQVSGFPCQVETFDGNPVSVHIFGNLVAPAEEDSYYVLYLVAQQDTTQDSEAELNRQLVHIITATNTFADEDEAIQMALALAGHQMRVSRVYIFEEISPTTTRNTYEWCAPGVQPAIQQLQNLDKADYPYDVIIESGMFIAGDVSRLPLGEREILEMQGIRALAIIPFFDLDKPLGYVGFDDTSTTREWSHHEVQFLQQVSFILVSLFRRRNAKIAARQSFDVLRLITDNSEDIIYANGLDDYKLRFVSRSLANALGSTPEELVGKVCYQVFPFADGNGVAPCSFCPVPHIRLEPGQDRSDVYVWENTDSLNGKTYHVKDTIIKWIDGQYVHMETASDISQRKQYEAQLQQLASYDRMTGVYNREWGTDLFSQRLQQGQEGNLCFIDLDGLKHTNDNFGHAAGDEMLAGSVKVYKAHLGYDDIICRWGGDEFLLWIVGSKAHADTLLQRMQQDMEQQNIATNKPYKLSFSYGIVHYTPGQVTTLDALVTAADKRMYDNKMEKRGLAHKRRRDDEL